nr:hypothetical protein [Tanacetum cinerariifolium]
MPSLEDIGIFEDSHDDENVFGVEAGVHNLDSTFQVSPILTIRIHKDHPLEQVIRDLHSAPRTRRMSKNLEEHGLVGTVIPRTDNKDLENCLFACFLSQLEPKKVNDVIRLQASVDRKMVIITEATIQEALRLDDAERIDCLPNEEIFTELSRMGQDKYVEEILKKFGFSDVKKASTPMETSKPFLKDKDREEVDAHMYRSMISSLIYLTLSRPYIMFAVFGIQRTLHDLVAYTGSDYAGASLDRKSTTGGCQFLRCRLISWQCKKQTVVENSTTEAEYVAASSYCGQVLWIQNQLLDYGVNAAIDVVKVFAVKYN